MSEIQDESHSSSEQRSSGRATMVVMACTGLSRMLGFVRNMVVSSIFGGGAVADVLNVAFQIPNTLRRLLAEGALSTAFIPIFTKTTQDKGGKAKSESLLGAMFSFQLWVLIPLMLLCFLFAGPLAALLWSFPDAAIQVQNGAMVVNQARLAAEIFPWMMLYLVFVSFSAIFMAILNVHQKFTIPALAPLLFSASVILMLLALNQQFYAWAQIAGVLLGGLTQMGILVWGFARLRYKVRIPLAFWRNPDMRAVLAFMVPVLGSSLIATGSAALANIITPRMVEGSATALNNSLLFWQLPFGMFSASVSTVLFPKLASLLAKDDRQGVKSTLLYGLRLIMHLLVPSAVLLMVFGHEIIAVVLQRGIYTSAYTEMTARVLTWYAVGMFFQGGVGFLQRFFFAARLQKIPLQGAIMIGLIDATISIATWQLGLGVEWLAIANSFSSAVGFVWLFLKARRELGGIHVRGLLSAALKTLLACVPMVLVILGWLAIDGGWWVQGSTVVNWIKVVVLVLVSALSVVAMYKVLKVEEFFSLLRRKTKQG